MIPRSAYVDGELAASVGHTGDIEDLAQIGGDDVAPNNLGKYVDEKNKNKPSSI